jgi:hypothetical protein
MRFWSTRAVTEPAPAEREDAVIKAVDAALGFVAGQRWVPRQMTIALLESVRDEARDVDAPEHLREVIEATLADCDSDRISAAALVDVLLDIRNGSRQLHGSTSGGLR